MGEFLPALLTIPVILQPGIRYPESGLSGYFSLVNDNRGPIIGNPVTFFADQIDVVSKISLIAVFHLVKFKHFDDSTL